VAGIRWLWTVSLTVSGWLWRRCQGRRILAATRGRGLPKRIGLSFRL